jgi:hypothetical protein
VAAPDGTVADTPVSGPAGGASYHFDWGRGGALEHRTPERQVTADSATHSVTELIDGLTPGAGCSPAACAATRRRPAAFSSPCARPAGDRRSAAASSC